MNIKLIPEEAMLAAHKHLPLYSKHQILIALAAALEAWHGMRNYTHPELGPHVILPIKEANND